MNLLMKFEITTKLEYENALIWKLWIDLKSWHVVISQ